MRLCTVAHLLLCMLPLHAVAVAQAPSADARYSFTFVDGGDGATTKVNATTMFSEELGYGYEPWESNHSCARCDTRPSFFSVKVPEGNYRVHVVLGASSRPTLTTLKSESGRLMLERIRVKAGEEAERTFTVNVRTPQLPKLPLNATGREEVSLDRFDESNARDWDRKLTIEVVGENSGLKRMDITPITDVPTIFLAGDSTVTDRNGGRDVSWGQLLPRFLTSGVVVANHAQSGETLKSFSSSLRLDKILSQMKAGDYLFLQFGHNDSKSDWPQTYAEAETTYKAWLKTYIAETRRRGATPVLVTSMDRADHLTGAPMHGLGLYPQAVREVAAEEHVPLIDLNTMSDILYVAAGADAPRLLEDGTHSTAYGGYEFAQCVVESIVESHMDLTRFVSPDFARFDPKRPDSLRDLDLDTIF